MRAYLFLLSFLFSVSVQAQNDSSKPKLKFHSINQLGILEGQAGTGFQVQSINGILFRKLFLGAGIGLDYYQMRSVPLFLDLRTYLLRSQKPFVYVDGGTHFPWARKSFDWPAEYKAGLFYDMGIGYSVPLRGCAFLVSAGYSYKAYKEIQRYPNYCLTPPCPETVYNNSYQLRRVSVKMGLSF